MLVNGTIQTLVFKMDYYDVYWRSDVRGASILMGAAAFLMVQQGRVPKSGMAVLPIGILGILLNINLVPDPIKYSMGSACLAAALALLPFSQNWLLRSLSWSPLEWAGRRSYSLYLWQQPFAFAGGDLAMRIARFPLCLLVSLFSFSWVEQPAQAALNRRISGLTESVSKT
jgi:peptidoglycan/LPS O-acetylase OafA/YrhL